MPTLYKISTELYEESFGLIALHSSLTPYAMAFYLNESLSMQLARTEKNLFLNDASFSSYEWYDESHDSFYKLYCNKAEEQIEDNPISGNLFDLGSLKRTLYLVPEKKTVDYFLKIEHEETINVEKLTKKIKTIPKLSMAYAVDYKQLKSKDNLISLSDAN